MRWVTCLVLATAEVEVEVKEMDLHTAVSLRWITFMAVEFLAALAALYLPFVSESLTATLEF